MRKRKEKNGTLSPLQESSSSLVEVLSDLDGFTVIGLDRRAAVSGAQMKTRKAMSYFSVGLRTGLAELALLPVLAPLSVGIWGGYVPLCGHFADSDWICGYGLLLSCWMPLLITGLLCVQIHRGAGPLWSRGFRRLLEGRTASLVIGTVAIFLGLRFVHNTIEPTSLFNTLRPFVEDTHWANILFTCLQRVYIHLGYSAAFVVYVLSTAAVVPWVLFLVKVHVDHRYQMRLREILD